MTRREGEQSPGASQNPLGSDEILAYLQKAGLPLTRENYLAISYPDGLPEPWTQELENELPLEFQKTGYISPPESERTAQSPQKNTQRSPFQQQSEQNLAAGIAAFNKANAGKTWADLEREREQSPPLPPQRHHR